MALCKNSPILLDQMPETLAIIEDLEKLTDVHLIRVLILRAHGGQIRPHRDGDIFGRDGNLYRLHLPIVTNDQVVFKIKDHQYRLEEGKLYFADVSKMHEVCNNGDEDRIHLVIDVKVNEKIKELFK